MGVQLVLAVEWKCVNSLLRVLRVTNSKVPTLSVLKSYQNFGAVELGTLESRLNSNLIGLQTLESSTDRTRVELAQ